MKAVFKYVYECEFCHLAYTDEQTARSCETKCKSKAQAEADKRHKIAVIRNKSMELDKLVASFKETYKYDPRIESEPFDSFINFTNAKKIADTTINKAKKTLDDKNINANSFLTQILEVLDNITEDKQEK